MDWLFNTQSLIALATLTALEIVLGIDNIVFISILASRLPAGQKERARVVGLALAIVIAVIVMMFSVNAISGFVDRHPTVKMLALSFLILIGVSLVAEGLDFHIPKGYIYFAMAFSVFVEFLNHKVGLRYYRPIHLRKMVP
jgi:predicted tellurium resistance membrane protein TerC